MLVALLLETVIQIRDSLTTVTDDLVLVSRSAACSHKFRIYVPRVLLTRLPACLLA